MKRDERGIITLDPSERDALGGKWRKSTKSGPYSDNCAEVAPVFDPETQAIGAVAMRDSKDPRGPILVFSPGQWSDLTTAVHDGRFDLPPPAA